MTTAELAERDLYKAVVNLNKAQRRGNVSADELAHLKELVELRTSMLELHKNWNQQVHTANNIKPT